MWKCPECQEKIESLQYRVNTESCEYGTASLETNISGTRSERIESASVLDYESSDSGDTSWTDNPVFSCGECDAEISLSSLKWVEDDEDEDDEEEEEEEYEETKHSIVKPREIIQENDRLNQEYTSIICKKCTYVYPNYDGRKYGRDIQTHMDCPKCGTTNSAEECSILIKDGYFSKKQHEHPKNRNKS